MENQVTIGGVSRQILIDGKPIGDTLWIIDGEGPITGSQAISLLLKTSLVTGGFLGVVGGGLISYLLAKRK